MKKKWNLYSISESRTIIMGFATLLVVLFHSYYREIGTVLNIICKTGEVGVDIFLFVSAIGLFFSFTKNSNVKEFYKKRLIRILPSIFIIRTIYYLFSGVDILTYLERITLISLFIDGSRDLWFFTLIIILYFLYPLLYKVIDRKGIKGLLLLLLITYVFNMLLHCFDYSYYLKIEIALTRIPVFLFGIYVGKDVFNKREISKYNIILFFLIFIILNILLFIGNISSYMLVRYMLGLLGISIVFIIAFIHSFWSNKYIDKILTFFGKYSMEVYLIFEPLSFLLKKLIIIHNNTVFYMIVFILTIGLSLFFKLLCNNIVMLIENKK
jgi:peptidoglycan/LPS O-acetylase OafA/YrhL